MPCDQARTDHLVRIRLCVALPLYVAAAASGCGIGNIGGNAPPPADGNIPDAVASDATTADAKPRSRSCKDLLFCDDFELNANGAAPTGWKLSIFPGTPGTIQVDGAHAASGSRAVRIVSVDSDRTITPITFVQMHHTMPKLPTNMFYGRIRVWATQTPTSRLHWNLIESFGYNKDVIPGPINGSMYQYGGGSSVDGDHALAAFGLGPGLDCTQQQTKNPPVALPTKKWACVEWQFDGIKNEMRLWVDGVAVDELTVTKPPCTCPTCGGVWPAPVFQDVRLGWMNARPDSGGPPLEIWMDDVAIDPERIYCQ